MFLKIEFSDQSALKIASDHQSQEAKVTLVFIPLTLLFLLAKLFI